MAWSRDQSSSSAGRWPPLGVDARRAEADQRADDGAGALRLAGAEVGMVQALDDTVGTLVNDQQVDDADGVALAQALELGERLAAEVGRSKPTTRSWTGPSGMAIASSLSRPAPCASHPELLRRESAIVAERLEVLELLDNVGAPAASGRGRPPAAGLELLPSRLSRPAWKPTPPSIIGARLSGLSSIGRITMRRSGSSTPARSCSATTARNQTTAALKRGLAVSPGGQQHNKLLDMARRLSTLTNLGKYRSTTCWWRTAEPTFCSHQATWTL